MRLNIFYENNKYMHQTLFKFRNTDFNGVSQVLQWLSQRHKNEVEQRTRRMTTMFYPNIPMMQSRVQPKRFYPNIPLMESVVQRLILAAMISFVSVKSIRDCATGSLLDILQEASRKLITRCTSPECKILFMQNKMKYLGERKMY